MRLRKIDQSPIDADICTGYRPSNVPVNKNETPKKIDMNKDYEAWLEKKEKRVEQVRKEIEGMNYSEAAFYLGKEHIKSIINRDEDPYKPFAINDIVLEKMKAFVERGMFSFGFYGPEREPISDCVIKEESLFMRCYDEGIEDEVKEAFKSRKEKI